MTVWLDGERCETPRIPFDPADRGLLLGDGLFDTSLVLGGRVVWREAHLERLQAACRTLGIPLDPDLAARSMDMAAEDAGTGSVRVTVTRGSGPRGLLPPPEPRPTILAANAAGSPALAFAPIRLWPTAIRRNETSPASRVKALNYLDAVLALGEARRHDCDETLFLNTAGHVACCGAGNLFALTGNSLATPPLSDGVLPGIARGAILRLAPRIGLCPREISLSPDDIRAADALFLTNSLRLLAPVSALGQHVFPPGPATSTLRRLAEILCDDIEESCGLSSASPLQPGRIGA
ncbi:aminotransferase class IV [Aureimonas psammosilenae]|uniref:aminotransferase class IV n=1 Tax=Aureimonas psammosilenae TaxID=2495496 RepID=UPI00126095DC|nr:aminodeoxychorismate lyase [Aureimonas psammosilenae]